MAGTNSPSDISRRDMILKTGAILVAGVTGTAAEGAPGAENVRKSTKDAVEALRTEFPNFKLSSDAQQCLDDKIVDPDCDGLVDSEVILNKKRQQLETSKQQLETSKQQLETSKQQLEIVEKANQNLEIVIGLIQLGMYVDYGKVPSPQANYIEKVQKNKDTPKEIQQLFAEIHEGHQRGLPLPYNPYGKKLLSYAKIYLDKSIKLQEQITNPKSRTGMKEITNNAHGMLSGYEGSKLTQKAG